MRQEIMVAEGVAPVRIDRYLSSQSGEWSRSYLQKLLKDEAVMVNGRPVKNSYQIAAGDRIILTVPEPVESVLQAEDMALDICYEDEDLLVVNKPKGMVVHPAAGHGNQTLVNGLLYHCQGSLSGINGELRPGIVHRIDMDTTGLLIVCKNDAAHHRIAEQLKEHSITRTYFAIVNGVMKEDEGIVNAPIGRHPTERKKMSINEKHGKAAVTHYRVIERFQGYTFIECRLETGRTHQIRVHLASLSHPLLGDAIYGPQRCLSPALVQAGIKLDELQGQTLHAGVIGFIHPQTDQYMEFQAPLPEYFQNILVHLRKLALI